MHKASEGVHSCQSVCAQEAPPAKSVFPPASAAVFIPAGCHRWLARGSSHPPVVSASEHTAALRSGAPRVFTLALSRPGFAGRRRWWRWADCAHLELGAVVIGCGGWRWHRGRMCEVILWSKYVRTYFFFFFFTFLATVSSNRNKKESKCNFQ